MLCSIKNYSMKAQLHINVSRYIYMKPGVMHWGIILANCSIVAK